MDPEPLVRLVARMEKRIVLQCERVSYAYHLADGSTVDAVCDVSLALRRGEFVSVIGPSGCGKSTLVKLFAGLLEPSDGVIRCVARGDSPPRRGVVFQHYGLFPWLTVAENVAFGLMVMGTASDRQREIVDHYLEVVGLTAFASARPRELSGGMQQRVALARTLATDPDILLMDEPFAALDVQTKRFMQDLLLQVWQREQRTVFFVTHDVEEALFMSDVVYLMSARPGRMLDRVDVPLPRPRNLDIEFSDAFVQLKRRVQEVVTREALQLVKLDLDVYKGLRV